MEINLVDSYFLKLSNKYYLFSKVSLDINKIMISNIFYLSK